MLIEFHFRVVVKKNNVEWSNDSTKIHCSIERLFTREGEFNETAVNQFGSFIDVLRVVSLVRIQFFR
jgi:hypothetical protein